MRFRGDVVTYLGKKVCFYVTNLIVAEMDVASFGACHCVVHVVLLTTATVLENAFHGDIISEAYCVAELLFIQQKPVFFELLSN